MRCNAAVVVLNVNELCDQASSSSASGSAGPAIPTFAIVTGASRGVGRELAVELGKQVPGPVAIVLVARGAAAMEEVKKAVLEVRSIRVVALTAAPSTGMGRVLARC